MLKFGHAMVSCKIFEFVLWGCNGAEALGESMGLVIFLLNFSI